MIDFHRIANVCWRIGGIDYVMMYVQLEEMKRMRDKNQDLLGIPIAYAFDKEGDVQWFPDCLQGEPVIRLQE